MDNLRAYSSEEVILELPGDITVFEIDWLSIYDVETRENYGSINIPDGLNVPPSLIKITVRKPKFLYRKFLIVNYFLVFFIQKHVKSLPNCLQLHKDLQVSWEIFGPAITIELAGQVAEDEYMAFGLSGSNEKSQMLGADVTIAYIDGYLGVAADYNITALAPCGQVLGQYKGVCKDDVVGGQDSNQLHTATRENGINFITYRRSLISRTYFFIVEINQTHVLIICLPV